MTLSITVLGIVQGVGYRPFVARLAQKLGITGTVKNRGGMVEILANGENERIQLFLEQLQSAVPVGAQVTKILTEWMPEKKFETFQIIKSTRNFSETPLIPADLPMCEDCKRELYQEDNRRYRYPFISCVACGPRYSILNALPYDRETITMRDFAMCAACKQEYCEENNRRRHAQTISCHECGPQLILQTQDRTLHEDEALQNAIQRINQGGVIAVKGIGGYQFACLPTDTHAVAQLRLLKRRDKKPFAVMFPSLQMIWESCEVSTEEEQLLTSPARPIVLLKKKKDTFCTGVSGESRLLGAFLAYTPLHQLLTDSCGPLVMTSGNLTDEPICTEDTELLCLQSPYLAGVLYNLRRIVTPLDDSVARVVENKPQVIRRSRGYVPLPIWLKKSTAQPVLAMGGDLKSGFCLYQNDRAYMSQYFGDMEHLRVFKTYQENLVRMEQLFGIRPEMIACDFHPQYHTARLAEELARTRSVELVRIQHHHAHAASVMAEHNLASCIGVVFDGTGYGTDGMIWGGEFLSCKGNDFKRQGHLSYVTLCGGDAAAKNAELTLYSYLAAAGINVENERYTTIQAAIQNKVNTQRSSSMGRLFDAVSATLGIRTQNSYEGECAIALENAAAADTEAPYPLHFHIRSDEKTIQVDPIKMVQDIFVAYQNGVDRGALALGFHQALAEMVVAVCIQIRQHTGEQAVALSGGVFANLILVEACVKQLKGAGFTVYLNVEIPTNDGGIALGQAWLCRKD